MFHLAPPTRDALEESVPAVDAVIPPKKKPRVAPRLFCRRLVRHLPDLSPVPEDRSKLARRHGLPRTGSTGARQIVKSIENSESSIGPHLRIRRGGVFGTNFFIFFAH